MRIQVGVTALLFNDKREVLLCLRRDYPLWNVPGGSLESHESPWEGVIRETREEVGLDVAVEYLSGLYWRPEQEELVFVFVCSIAGGKLSKSDEAADIRYFALDSFPDNVSPRLAERVRDALASQGQKVALKEQTGKPTIETMKKRILNFKSPT